jgi:hypothetical protein
MSNGAAKTASSFGGTLYRSFKNRVDDVGTMSLAFGDANSGTLTYKLDGVETRKRIVREQFSGLVSTCSR